ncbi:hypothetical protein [Aestuariivirga sp.]|jgi:hypothetical protein|uniref:hypothetical protein n=1 Tax=Aestuariivirga sp. TaxID=2650926 RepID=UPI00378341C3
MTSAFDALDALASDAALEGFGEEAVLIPRRGSQYAEAAADADRMAVKVRGIFSALAATSDLRGQSRGGEFRGTTRLVSEQSAFWIAAAQVAELGFRPAKGDLLRLPARCGSPSYAIAAIHPTSMGDLNLLLVREDVAE